MKLSQKKPYEKQWMMSVLIACGIALCATGAPIGIGTIDDLQKIGNDPGYPLTGDYFLTQDIDASATATWNGGAGFVPIGSVSNFRGTLDGQGYVISNLHIDRPGESYIGLFKTLDIFAVVQNLGMENGLVRGNDEVAALASNNSGTISNCWAALEVKSNSRAGGLVAGNYNVIQNSFSACDVEGDQLVGGFAGANYVSASLTNCYFTGSVSGTQGVGGLVGHQIGTITNCYAAGVVQGTGIAMNIGGLAGVSEYWHNVYASFWDMEITGQSYSNAGKGLATAQMKTTAVFRDAGWGRGSAAWTMTEGAYPRLAWEGMPDDPIPAPASVPLTGSGTALDPYLVGTPEEFASLSWHVDVLSAHIQLTTDVDCASVVLYPIGDLGAFTGVFDGGGHVVGNAAIAQRGSDCIGVFSQVKAGGTIQDLRAQGVSISGDKYVGGLVGRLEGALLRCSVSGNVSGDYFVGGLVGHNMGTISSSCAAGALTAYPGGGGYRDNIGGLIGANAGTVTMSYATNSIEGFRGYIGGLVGHHESGSVTACYAVGAIPGDYLNAQNVGGLIGGRNTGTVNISFWDVDATGLSGSNGGKRLVGEDMRRTTTYQNAGWAAYDWVMNEGDYPRLNWENTGAPPIPAALPVPLDGDGTALTPYLVRTPEEFALLSWYVAALNAHVRLAAGLDCSGITLHPIGDLGVFSGVFDGNNHVILNAAVEQPDNRHVGLFSWLAAGGEVKNLSVTRGAALAKSNVGILVGHNFGTVTHCNVGGMVKAIEDAGGLVGANRGVVSDCYATAAVQGHFYLGGLIGKNHGTAVRSYAIGPVTGYYTLGGLVGQNYGGAVTDCYAAGAIVGRSLMGGLVGMHTHAGTIASCYATGPVAGNTGLGGLVGLVDGGGPITASFWDTETGGPNNGVGVGLSTAAMKQQSTFTDAGWDFTGPPPVWAMHREGFTYPQIEGMPVPIGTIEALQGLASVPDAHYFLYQDIDAYATQTWSDKSTMSGFEPIGTISAPFTGLLDGRGHRVFGLHIHRPSEDGVGLFGHIGVGGVVRGVGVEAASVTGQHQTGGLAGVNAGAVERCYTQCVVTGIQEVGGLVGKNSGVITESYAASSLSGIAPGGLVGADAAGVVSASFWDTLVSGVLSSGGGAGRATAPMQTSQTFTDAGWDMTTAWTIHDGFSYPYFRGSIPARVITPPPLLINADTVEITVQSFLPSLFVTVGGGAYPVWHKYTATGQAIIEVPLRQEAINSLIISILSETGEEVRLGEYLVYESVEFPATSMAITNFTLTPTSATLAQYEPQQFIARVTFENSMNADVTSIANWNAQGGSVTPSGLYVHGAAAAGMVQALLNTRSGWRQSNIATITLAKEAGAEKSGTGWIGGVVRSHYTQLGLEYAAVTAFDIFSQGVAAQHGVMDKLGNYAFALPESIYHFEGDCAGHRSETLVGGILREPAQLINPGPPAVWSSPYYWGQIKSDRPLEQIFSLRPNDAQAPWVYFVEPTASCTVVLPYLVVTAINADKYSDLLTATFTINANTHDIRDRISSTGFYRETWALTAGLNVLHLYSMDTEGNASERTLEVVYDPWHDPTTDPPAPPPEGPPAEDCVAMTVANIKNDMSVRGNAVTLFAEPASGDLASAAAVSFEVKGPGTGYAWQMIGAATTAPFAVSWNASALSEGMYQIRAVAISLEGCLDYEAAEKTVTISSGAAYHERIVSGMHTLTAPITASEMSVLALSEGERFARIVLPAGAIGANDVLTAYFPDVDSFNPALTSRQQDAELYIDISLQTHTGNFLGGKRAVLEMGYTDTDNNGFLDTLGLRVSQLLVKYLPSPAGAFSALPVNGLSTSRRCVIGETSHFSVFGVVEEQPSAPLSILTETLPEGQEGVAYAADLEAIGGIPPISWSVVSGALPGGLSLNGAAVAGTPTETGDFSFALRAADSQVPPGAASRSFAIHISGANQPTATITRAPGQPSIDNSLPLAWNITFSEAVTGFDTSDIAMVGTAASGATFAVAGNNANYSLTVTALTHDGTLRPTTPAGAALSASTLAPNRASANEEPVWVDRNPPLADILCDYPDAQKPGSEPVEITQLPILFNLYVNESVTGLIPAGVEFEESISGLAYQVSGSGKKYALLITAAQGPTTITPRLKANAIQDTAGNGNAITAYSGRPIHYVPTVRHSVTLNQGVGQPDPTNALPIVFDIVFSDSVTGFDVGDIVYVTGPQSAPNPTCSLSGNGALYTLTVTSVPGDGQLRFVIPEDVTNEGNEASTSTDNVVTYDKAPPEFTAILVAPSPAGVGAHVAIHFHASEALNGLPVATVNGNAAGYASHSGSDYIFNYTVSAGDPNGAAVIAISGTDLAGNPGLKEDTTSLVIDLTKPTADFSADVTSGPAPLTVKFKDESVSGASPIDAWDWDFGDGETSYAPAPTHVYELPGVYTVSLTITTTDASDTVTKTNYIQVLDATPVGAMTAIIALAIIISVVVMNSAWRSRKIFQFYTSYKSIGRKR